MKWIFCRTFIIIVVFVSGLFADICEQGFSECGQDKYILTHLFEHKRDGCFIEIQSEYPMYHSHTLLFEKLGWRGACLDPNPKKVELLKQFRKANCVNASISGQEGFSQFLLIHGPVAILSTEVSRINHRLLHNIVSLVKKEGGTFEILKIKNVLFSELYQSLNEDTVDLLVLGNSALVGKVFLTDSSEYDVHVLVVERDLDSERTKKNLEHFNFSFLTKIGGDDFYINKRYI